MKVMAEKVHITLVGTIGCKGTEEAEKTILEILNDSEFKKAIIFKKIIYTGIENNYDPPIFGSPTILINGKDLVFERSDMPISFA